MKSFLYSLFTYIRNIVSYFLALCILIVFVPPLLLAISMPASWRYESRIVFWLLRFLYQGVVFATLMPVTVEGKENITDEPAIIIANHQSSIDIPILGSVLGTHPHIWFVIIDFLNTPFLGYFVSRMGVWVDRSSPVAGARSIIQGIRLAQEHRAHIIIFPEGGRYIGGPTQEFLGGFAVLARKSGRKVIPVYMPYNWRILLPHHWILGYSKIHSVIGPSFELGKYETDKEFIGRLAAWYNQKSKEFSQ